MDQDVEILPSSSFHQQQHLQRIPLSMGRRTVAGGSAVSYGVRPHSAAISHPHRATAGNNPSMFRVERQMPLSFQRTNQRYDGPPRQTAYGAASNGKVVLLPRVNANATHLSGESFKRMDSMVPRGLSSYRVDGSGNRYIVTPNGHYTRVHPMSRLSSATAPMRHNLMMGSGYGQNHRSFLSSRGDVKPFSSLDELGVESGAMGEMMADNNSGGYYGEQRRVQQQTFVRQLPYAAYGRQHDSMMIADQRGNALQSGFRRVDYATVGTSENFRRPLYNERIRELDFQDGNYYTKRDLGTWGPRLIPVGGASGGGYRVASDSPPPAPTTRLRPVNPWRAFASQSCGSAHTQIRIGDSTETKACKAVLRDIIDEICASETAQNRAFQNSGSANSGQSFDIKDEVNDDNANQTFYGNDEQNWRQFEQEQLKSTLQQKFGDDCSSDEIVQMMQRTRVRPRVSSPIARQIVHLRDVNEKSFEDIARQFKLEPNVVRFAYVQLKKHSFRNVGRPRKSDSEERKQDLIMPFVSSGKMPPANNQVGIPSPAVPLPARYTSDELNIFLEVYRKEVTKRRIALEKRAEEETGIVMPWHRTRSKNVKTTKRQVYKVDTSNGMQGGFTLCDPRYISLGGNTVPFEEMPMKMELDLSGNAKITTQSDMLSGNNENANNNSSTSFINNNAGGSNDENDESNEEEEGGDENVGMKTRSVRKMGAEIGNDESENDSAAAAGGETSVDEDEQDNGTKRLRTAKFAPLTKPNLRQTTAQNRRLAKQEEVRLKKEAKAQLKEKKRLKTPKSRAIGQQERRDRERRLHIIQMRKMMKNKLGKGPAEKEDEETAVPLRRGGRTVAKYTTAVVKKSTILRQKILDESEKDGERTDTGPVKYCPCGGPYDPKKFYVSCGTCSRWYHAKCAGITEKRAQKLDNDVSSANTSSSGWTCPDCEKSTAEVYCVCRRPYDDTRFYVGCDSCEDWFHPECIGTTQAEVSKHDTFLCPKCRESEDI